MFRENATPDTSLLIAAFQAKVFGIDRVTGAIRWKVVLEQTVSSDPVELAIADGAIIAASRNKLAFIEYATGRVHKLVARAGSYVGRPAMVVAGEQILIGGSGQVECYTPRGDVVWVQGFKGEGQGAVALGLPGQIRQADGFGNS